MSRHPSARAHEEVLAAALKLITERGVDAVSVDAIAETSGVSKATIYKHWAGKEALCLEAIGKLQSDLPPSSSAGDARADMVRLLRHLADAPRPRRLMRIMPKIFGHASRNPQFAKAWGERIEEPRRTRLTELIHRAIAAGQLRPDVDVRHLGCGGRRRLSSAWPCPLPPLHAVARATRFAGTHRGRLLEGVPRRRHRQA